METISSNTIIFKTCRGNQDDTLVYYYKTIRLLTAAIFVFKNTDYKKTFKIQKLLYAVVTTEISTITQNMPKCNR